MSARPSPFHVRTAEHNSGNDWITRGGFTLAARYGDARQEALAARAGVVLVDATFMSRLRIHGRGAEKLLSAACAVDVQTLESGQSRRVYWCADGGGVRGIGVAARFGAENFVLRSFASDAPWFHNAAKRFEASVRDETDEKGFLFLLGPVAADLVAFAGIQGAGEIAPGCHRVFDWRGITVTLSRWSTLSRVLGGCEIACANDDAVSVFDRVWRTGRNFALVLAGQEAFDTLLLEQGVPLPGVDFKPARDAKAREPRPAALGLSDADGSGRTLAGLELESDAPVGFVPAFAGGRAIGAVLRSAYSPVLRRAIALAELEREHAAPGTPVQVRRLTRTGIEDVPARVAALPFIAPV
ncbi:MAG: glycine cleavage T C-terminal barrel domain-containing protein [Alphaproteobacteria bacterium]